MTSQKKTTTYCEILVDILTNSLSRVKGSVSLIAVENEIRQLAEIFYALNILVEKTTGEELPF